ncbi:MAG: FecR family protein [Pseudomonadota bacterium]
MLGIPPGATQRDLLVGQSVVRDERITTSSDGTGQLMFLDQTTLTVAPRSDIVLDSYAFNPETDSGEMAITLTRGALRFIGGRISKSNDVIVKTPTATIGIRGGLTLISVSSGGFTRVVQLAGEYTRVSGPGGGTITLSRPNASAQVGESGEVQFTGLVDSEEIAEQFGAMEGGGDGGTAAGDDKASVEGRTSTVARQNSGVLGGAERPPVSTSGEQEPPRPPQSEETATDGSRRAAIDPVSEPAETPAQTLVPPVPPPVAAPEQSENPLPPGGAMFIPSSGYLPFEDVARGSLIGIGPEGERAVLPIPETPAELTRDLPGVQTTDFFALSQSPNAGFARFSSEDGALIDGVGPVFGIGFSDFDNGFHFYQVSPENSAQTAAPDPELTQTIANFPIDETGLVVFGTPSPGQAAVFRGDTGQIAATANTISTYRIEPDTASFGLDVGDFSGRPPAMMMIGNGGEARFDTNAAALPSGRGGRVLVAEMRIETAPNGEQFSDFSVFAAPIKNNGSDSPSVGAAVFSSSSSDFEKSFGTSNIGTFEDADGNTVFGPEDNYFVVSSLFRPGGTGLLIFDPGVETLLGGPRIPISPFSSLLTHDPDAGEVIADPLSLAADLGSRISPPGTFDAVFATGIATCSTGTCGFDPIEDRASGVYPVMSVPFEFGGTSGITFQGANGGVDTNSFAATFDLEDRDASSGLFGAPFPGPTQLPGPTQPPPPDGPLPPGGDPGVLDPGAIAASTGNLTFTFDTAANDFSAYASDDAFAAFFGTEVILENSPAPASFSIASAGLAGDGGLIPAGVDKTPEFLRWGWWSAALTSVDQRNGSLRDDLVHLGTWVAGVQPDPADIPLTGVVSYAGLAAGTDVNLSTGITRSVGGGFSLTYDFGTNRGDFNLNIAGLDFRDVAVNGGSPGLSATYGGFANAGPRNLSVDGAFVSGAGNPVAGTVGQFKIDDVEASRQVVGVFGGDAQ